MNEEPKSIWKKSWKGPRGLLLTFTVLTVVFFVVSFSAGFVPAPLKNYLGLPVFSLLFSACIVLFAFLAIGFIRWVCCWRNFKRFLFGLACFVTLIALFYAEEDWRGKHDWEQFKHQWEAKGEKFNFTDFVPPLVPDDQNFALTPIVASCYSYILDKNGHQIQPQDTNVVDRLQMTTIAYLYGGGPPNDTGDWQKSTVSDLKVWQQYYRVVAAKTNEFPVPAQPQSPAADVLLALSKYDSAIKELRQASQLPYSRFPLNYDCQPPAEILLPHLAAMKRCSQVLQLRSIAELQTGQSEKSLDDVKLSLRLTDSIYTEPFLISHLVRMALLQLTLQPVWEGLAEHKWSDKQLGEFDSEFSKLDILTDYEFTIRGERALGIADIDFIRRMRELSVMNYTDDGRSSPSRTIQNVGLHLMPSGWFYQNELAIAQMYQRWILPPAEVKHQIVSPKEVHRNETNELSRLAFYDVFARMIFPALSPAVKRFAYAKESVDLARVAIALERYRLAHGEYPESLAALSPLFMEKIPHDIINGQPLHYRRTSDGQFVLYSIGWNETDDGGEVGLTKDGVVDRDTGDWVWRYPSK